MAPNGYELGRRRDARGAPRVKVVESETSAATFVDVPDALFADPAYAALRRAYGKVADIVGLPPYTLAHGKKRAAAETSRRSATPRSTSRRTACRSAASRASAR